MNILKDDAPAVARQAITCAVNIFRCTLVKVAIQVGDVSYSEYYIGFYNFDVVLIGLDDDYLDMLGSLKSLVLVLQENRPCSILLVLVHINGFFIYLF